MQNTGKRAYDEIDCPADFYESGAYKKYRESVAATVAESCAQGIECTFRVIKVTTGDSPHLYKAVKDLLGESIHVHGGTAERTVFGPGDAKNCAKCAGKPQIVPFESYFDGMYGGRRRY